MSSSKEGGGGGGRRRVQLVDANDRFLRSVTALLADLDDKSQTLNDKAAERVQRLKESLEEQQEVMRPRLQRAMEKLDERQQDAKTRAARVLTGRENMSIDEWLSKAKVIRTMDKITYVSGVAFMLSTEYAMLRAPDLFRFYFAVACIGLLATRAWSYWRSGMMGFMGDYCYVCNLLCVVNAVLLPRNPFLWQVNFVAANGPLLWAIVAWRNSLVLHDLDKIVSIFIHYVPALLSYSMRWNVHPSPMCPGGVESGCGLSLASGFLVPMGIYAAWQTAYLVVTEIFMKKTFERNPTLMTSLRWIVRDTRNSTHNMMLDLGRQLKILGPEEGLDLNTRPLVPIALFTGLQFAFTVATFAPAALLFRSQMLHRLVLIGVGATALWNGAGFMFHVFVLRYEQSLRQKVEEGRAKKKRNSDAASVVSEADKRTSRKRESRRISGERSKINKGFCAPPNQRERAQLEQERALLRMQGDSDEEGDVPLVRLPSI